MPIFDAFHAISPPAAIIYAMPLPTLPLPYQRLFLLFRRFERLFHARAERCENSQRAGACRAADRLPHAKSVLTLLLMPLMMP
jgi:hypothetical protein